MNTNLIKPGKHHPLWMTYRGCPIVVLKAVLLKGGSVAPASPGGWLKCLFLDPIQTCWVRNFERRTPSNHRCWTRSAGGSDAQMLLECPASGWAVPEHPAHTLTRQWWKWLRFNHPTWLANPPLAPVVIWSTSPVLITPLCLMPDKMPGRGSEWMDMGHGEKEDRVILF